MKRKKFVGEITFKEYALQYYNSPLSLKHLRRKWKASQRQKERRYLKVSGSAASLKRNAQRDNATPPWINKNAVKKYYDIARVITSLTGHKAVVDHYYPLQSKTICGLHCEGNLVLMWTRDNAAKSNKVPSKPFPTTQGLNNLLA